MKTKLNFFRLMIILVMTITSTVAMAQSQSGTQTVCIGSQPYHVDASLLPNPTYTWSVSGGGNITSGQGTTSIVVDWTTAGGPYTLSVFTTSNGCAGDPQSVLVTVNPQPVGPTLLAMTPASPVCDGTLVSATFTQGSGGVGCTDEYQYRFDGAGAWTPYVAASTINTTGHTLVEIQGRRSGCAVGAGCTGTNWVTLATWTVTSILIPTVNVVADANPVCQGTSVTFTANVTNAGTPSYEWHVNGGAIVGTASTYTYVPAIGDVVTCIVTGNGPCVSTVPVTGTNTPTVNPKPVTSGIWHN